MNCTEQTTIDKLRHMKESEDHVEFKSARHNILIMVVSIQIPVTVATVYLAIL